jgi:hypothetical protein
MADNMNDEVYRLPGKNDGLPMMGHLTACHRCGRKVLVELVLIGVPHHVKVLVTCGECLVLSEQIRKAQPAITAKIEAWLQTDQAEPRP